MNSFADQAQIDAPGTSARPGDPKRILVADDDAGVCWALADVLESEGYQVDQARNGVEAVARATESAPDLVLLDLNMPHRDGWTALPQIEQAAPLVPVIVITARPNQYREAVRFGVDAFMEKPLNIPLLLKAVKQLVGEPPMKRAARVTAPGFLTCELVAEADPVPVGAMGAG